MANIIAVLKSHLNPPPHPPPVNSKKCLPQQDPRCHFFYTGIAWDSTTFSWNDDHPTLSLYKLSGNLMQVSPSKDGHYVLGSGDLISKSYSSWWYGNRAALSGALLSCYQQLEVFGVWEKRRPLWRPALIWTLQRVVSTEIMASQGCGPYQVLAHSFLYFIYILPSSALLFLSMRAVFSLNVF